MRDVANNRTVLFQKGSKFSLVTGENYVLDENAEATILGNPSVHSMVDEREKRKKKNDEEKKRIMSIYEDSF